MGRPGRGRAGAGGVSAYYCHPESGYLCFSIGPTGKHARLHLGNAEDEGSVLRDFVAGLPAGRFAGADLRGAAGTGLVGRRERARACLDVLLHIDHVREANRRGQRQHYELTPEGRSLQRRLQ